VRESRVIDVPPMRTFGRMTFKQGRWGQQVGTHPDRIVEVGTTGPVLPGRRGRCDRPLGSAVLQVRPLPGLEEGFLRGLPGPPLRVLRGDGIEGFE
jgi:hypothetical protein